MSEGPSAEAPTDSPGASRGAGRGVLRTAFQLGGFLVGIALLVWCVARALDAENRAQFEHLRQAPAGLLGAAVALSGLSIILNGQIFWAVLYPVRRLRPADVVAVNALATFLNNLPFKVSVLSRVLIHRGRDGVPVFVIGGWITAVGVVLAVVIGALALATAITRRLTLSWGAIAAAALVLGVALTIGLARLLEGERGLARVYALVDAFRVRPLSRLVRARFVRDLHEALTMLASPGAVGLAVVLRLTDTLAQGARFVIVAAILGRNLGFDEAFLYSATYFIIGVLSPVGMLGFRESGTAAVAAFAGIADPRGFLVVPLLVGAVDAVVNLAGAALAIAWLRPLRWLLPRGAPADAPAATSPS